MLRLCYQSFLSSFFVLWGWVWLRGLVPVMVCGVGRFFVLGCFLVAVGMGGAVFLFVGYVGWGGWGWVGMLDCFCFFVS